MDVLEYWIWEHASKYGMAKVLKHIRSSFSQIDLPNSWIGALVLRQIKKDWAVPGKITFREIIHAQEILALNFKFFGKNLKRFVKLNEFIKLTLTCKASILVKRLENSETSTWKRALDEMFPIWNSSVWNKFQRSFNIKNGVLEEEIKIFHSQLRCKLLQHNVKQQILDMFEDQMKKHFPPLITCLFRIQLSTLEKIQTKQTNLDPQLEFIRGYLDNDLVCEANLINLWDEFFRRKVKLKCISFLKKKENIETSSIEEDEEVIMDADIFTLPPQPSFQSSGEPIYPKCSELNPCMPSTISIIKDGVCQEFVVNKNAPQHISGTPFEFHWFSEVCSPIIKEEKMEENEQALQTFQEEAENAQKIKTEPPSFYTKDTAIQKASRIENWINSQQAGTPSSLDSNSTFTFEIRRGNQVKTKEALPALPHRKELSSVSTRTEENSTGETSQSPVKSIVKSESSICNSTFIFENRNEKHLKAKGKLLALPHQKESSSHSTLTEKDITEEVSQYPVKPIIKPESSFSSSTFTYDNSSGNNLKSKDELLTVPRQKEASSTSSRTEENVAEEASQLPVKPVIGPESSFKAGSSSSRQMKTEAVTRMLRSGSTSSLRNRRGSSDTTDSVKSRKRKTLSNATVATGSKMRRVSEASGSEPSFKLQLSVLSLTKRQNSAKSSKSKEPEKKKCNEPITVESLLVNKMILPNLAETLKEHAKGLMCKELTRNYARRLNDCMVRVLQSHNNLMDTERTAERVKRATRK